MGYYRTTPAWQEERSWEDGRGQSVIHQCCVLDRTHRLSMARPARTVRAVGHGLQTVQSLVQTRCLGTSARGAWWEHRALESPARLDHRSSTPTCGGSKRGQDTQALGRSRGGFSTKIHVAVNEIGQPTKLHLTEGERHDVTCAEILLDGAEPDYVIADKAYDSDAVRERIRDAGAKPVIPTRSNRPKRRLDRARYKLRNVVERFIGRIKHCRRVATRYDKLAVTFLGFVEFASLITLI